MRKRREEGSMRFRYSPAVQTLATEHQIDLSRVQGSGMGGRITRKDVLAYIEREERQARRSCRSKDQSRAPKHRKKRYSLAGLRRFKVAKIRRLRNRRLHLAQLFRMCVIPGRI